MSKSWFINAEDLATYRKVREDGTRILEAFLKSAQDTFSALRAPLDILQRLSMPMIDDDIEPESWSLNGDSILFEEYYGGSSNTEVPVEALTGELDATDWAHQVWQEALDKREAARADREQKEREQLADLIKKYGAPT